MNRGITLMEVLVSLVIVAVAVTIAAQGFFAGAEGLVVAKEETIAAMLAERKMAELETGEISLEQGESGEFDDHDGYSYEVKSEATDKEKLYEVTVTIRYRHLDKERSYALHRLMRERAKKE